MTSPVAVITGASQGLGRALAHELASRGWSLVLDARHEAALTEAVRGAARRPAPGDRRRCRRPGAPPRPGRRGRRAGRRQRRWSTTPARWGPARCPTWPTSTPRRTSDSSRSTWSPRMALTAALLPQLRRHGGVVLNISSDASVEAYETWGGYGSSKAGLDHATRVLAAEEPAPAGVRRRPGRHADPDAPGRVPRRGHLRPARADGRRTGAAAAPRGVAAQRPLPRVGAAGRPGR